MKYLLNLTLFLLLALTTAPSAVANYTDVTYNEIDYRLFYSGYGSNAVADSAVVQRLTSSFNGTVANIASSITSSFYSDWNYITLTAPVTTIGHMAFEICTSLTSIAIPNSVTTIDDFAFYGCSSLPSITIPNSVASIGHGVLYNCSSLSRVSIPNSVTSIGSYLFGGCCSLTSIIVQSGNTVYDSRNNCNAIIETASNTLINGCQNTIIPNSVTSIGYGAFMQCTGLTSITIPNSVTTIDEVAFSECTSLTSVTIPNSVTTIDDAAFIGCSNLTSVIIGNAVDSIGSEVFYDCSSLTSVTCLAETPPTIKFHDNFFSRNVYTTATLYVPAGSLNAYQTTYPWCYFYKIEELSDVVYGDVDGDGRITINDVTTLINYLLSHDATGIDLENADVDCDGHITINDVTTIINKLLRFE